MRSLISIDFPAPGMEPDLQWPGPSRAPSDPHLQWSDPFGSLFRLVGSYTRLGLQRYYNRGGVWEVP